MSAAFKNAKKKLSQVELRKFMNEHRIKQKDFKKIESPLAKYNEQGQLTCVLCKSTVRSEAVWPIHVNAKQHKQNVEIARKLKEKINNFTTPLKRPLEPMLSNVQKKRTKGILKNANKILSDKLNNDNETSSITLPKDFFDLKNTADVTSDDLIIGDVTKNVDANKESLLESKDILPEGFFDDPKLNAKAKNQKYKDPIEEEWEKFVKAIKEANSESNAIIAEDQEEATTERQIDEIDEQITKLSRVLDLEKKKANIISLSTDSKLRETSEHNVELEDDDFNEFLDWRAKKSYE